MTIILHRTDPARRMARFYLLWIQPTLFGEWSVVAEWGGIGSPGQALTRQREPNQKNSPCAVKKPHEPFFRLCVVSLSFLGYKGTIVKQPNKD